jgi:phage baseplate assembly protein V
MWPPLDNLLRRARLRGLQEGQVQRARAESVESDAKDDAERFQDYGFTANPVDGQGLVINVAGHTIVLRMDRLAERPRMAAYEVAVWHKEGHRITLKAGGLVQVDCTKLVVNASGQVDINTPTTNISGVLHVGGNTTVGGSASVAGSTSVGADLSVAGNSTSTGNVSGAGVSLSTHTHGGVQNGNSSTGAPN